MAKNYSPAVFAAFVCFGLLSCKKEKYTAQKPVYLSIPHMGVTIESPDQGTSNQKINTVWILANNNLDGVYELPCTVPVLLHEGTNQLSLYEGISLNGVAATRAIYTPLNKINFNLNYTPSGKDHADTIVITPEHRTTTYSPFVSVNVLEDFDGTGYSFQKTSSSDTSFQKVSDPGQVFINPEDPSENNGKAGVLYTTSKYDFAEVASVNEYPLPQDGSNIFLELNYKCNEPFAVGVIGESPAGTEQRITAYVNPKDNWNKIYINLVTEVTAMANANNFKVFFGVQHSSDVDTGKVYLDNIKLIY